MKIKKFLAGCLLMLTALTAFTACGGTGNAKVIKDIAYNKTKSEQLVYISEDDTFVPYIVVTDDYQGNTLLVRKNVDYTYRFNKAGIKYASYYGESDVDKYLDTNIYQKYGGPEKANIVTTNVEIETKNAIVAHEEEKETISRKVFLLSMYEMGGETYEVAAEEGQKLDYFKNEKSRIANNSAGTAKQYFTRSAAYQERISVFGVNTEGVLELEATSGMNGAFEGGLRPAFCVKSDTAIETRNDIIEGEDVYVIKP